MSNLLLSDGFFVKNPEKILGTTKEKIRGDWRNEDGTPRTETIVVGNIDNLQAIRVADVKPQSVGAGKQFDQEKERLRLKAKAMEMELELLELELEL